MKKIFVLLFGLMLLPVSVQASVFKEGVNYEVVKPTASAQPEVMEFFSYYCPHCYTFEPFITDLKKSLGKNVEFKQNHVDFLGGAMGVELTRGLASAQLLGVEDEFTALVFKKLHAEHQQIDGETGLIALFGELNISAAKAKGTLESFSTAGLASQMQRNTEIFKIQEVPTLIVNGKYKVMTGSIKNEKELMSLVKYLLKKKN